MKLSRLVFFLFFWASVSLADEWKVFSLPSPVYSAIPYESGYVLATGGGIQFSTTGIKRLYTSADGLGATVFYAVAQTPQKIYGISEYGLISAYDKATGRWSIDNRSYLSANVHVVPGQATAVNDILVIAFDDKLAFYQTDKKAFFLTLEKIGDYSLVTKSPQKIEAREESLYVSLGDVVYG